MSEQQPHDASRPDDVLSEADYYGPFPDKLPTPEPANPNATPIWISLYNHNPFYVISALLMLFGVRSAYAHFEIGNINCWAVMGSLAGYTALLGVIAVLIVRLGKVWEDARSILMVMLLMFLAVSVSADDLFVKVSSAGEGTALMVFGYLFSAILTEAVLRGTGIRFGWRYRIPYHLFLMLFFATPWVISPEIHVWSRVETEWLLFLFPVLSGVVLLTLLPAVWGGPNYVKENGTPWGWPMFPWSAFFMIIVGVMLRSFALALTYGQSGAMWLSDSRSVSAISFDTIWGPHFLLPVVFAILVLLLEGSLVTKNRSLTIGVMCCTPLLLLMSIPIGGGKEYFGFLYELRAKIGSPIWIALCLQTALYFWAWYRRAPMAISCSMASVLAFVVIGPMTIDTNSLAQPQPIPFLVVGVVLMLVSLLRGSSFLATSAALCSILGFWLFAEGTDLEPWRMFIGYAAVWSMVIVFGLIYRDWFSGVLRMLAGFQAPVASYSLLERINPELVNLGERFLLLVLIAAVYFVVAWFWKSEWFLFGGICASAVLAYGVAVIGFHQAAREIGYSAMTALTLSVAMLVLGVLISGHKANWFRRKELASG